VHGAPSGAAFADRDVFVAGARTRWHIHPRSIHDPSTIYPRSITIYRYVSGEHPRRARPTHTRHPRAHRLLIAFGDRPAAPVPAAAIIAAATYDIPDKPIYCLVSLAGGRSGPGQPSPRSTAG